MSVDIIQSRCLQTDVPFAVIAPRRRPAGRHFPVVYMLHGMARWKTFSPGPMERAFFERMVSGSDLPVWIDGKEVRTMQELADALRTVIVAVNGGQGWYIDSPVLENCRYESHLIREVIPWVDRHYPTLSCATARALVGHSMGGFGAVRMLCKYPDLFHMAGARSASIAICRAEEYRPGVGSGSLARHVFGSPARNAAFRRSEEPLNLIQRLKRLDKRMILSIGIHDRAALVEANRVLHRKLLGLGIHHDYHETYDGHEFSPYMRDLTIACARELASG